MRAEWRLGDRHWEFPIGGGGTNVGGRGFAVGNASSRQGVSGGPENIRAGSKRRFTSQANHQAPPIGAENRWIL